MQRVLDADGGLRAARVKAGGWPAGAAATQSGRPPAGGNRGAVDGRHACMIVTSMQPARAPMAVCSSGVTVDIAPPLLNAECWPGSRQDDSGPVTAGGVEMHAARCRGDGTIPAGTLLGNASTPALPRGSSSFAPRPHNASLPGRGSGLAAGARWESALKATALPASRGALWHAAPATDRSCAAGARLCGAARACPPAAGGAAAGRWACSCCQAAACSDDP